MFDWLKDTVRPIRQLDPRFGWIQYLRAARLWEGKAAFRPIESEVEVLIKADEAGPTDEQRAFFGEIENRYTEAWPKIADLLKRSSHEAGSPAWEFVPVAIELPKSDIQDGGRPSWSLFYETRPPSISLTVLFKGFEPLEVVAER